MTRPTAGLLVSLALTAALSGCGGGEEPAAAVGAAEPAPAGARIVIENFAFSPSALTVRPGEQVTVLNRDRAAHTLTAEDKSFDSGRINQNETYVFTAPAAGDHPYICDLHQYMKGTLTVS